MLAACFTVAIREQRGSTVSTIYSLSNIAMSSGSLPGDTYHRASQLGAGTFGSVVVVYNDEGDEFALKLFSNDDEDHESDDDADSYRPPNPLNIGALREISALRLLREDNGHLNIARLVDVQTDWDDEETGGAGTGGCLSIALPLYKSGSLQAAIQKGIFRSYPRKVKVAVAHGILSAIAFVSTELLHWETKCTSQADTLLRLLCSFTTITSFIETSSLTI